jgi:elongation factor Ts
MPDIKLISELRTITGAPIADCKTALEEANDDLQKAQEILRKKGAAAAQKRAGKVAAEGVVASYIHAGGKIGVLLELNCETDFVAKTSAFQNLAKGLAMHVAASAPKFLSRDVVPAEVLDREKDIYKEIAKNEGKQQGLIDKIITGKLNAFFKESCLLEQVYIKDESKTVQQLIDEIIAEIGEKISVRRFTRYELGEGIIKQQTDFAKEVGGQLSRC